MSSTTTSTWHAPHWRSRASLVAAAALAVVLVPAQPASAHHGWDGFDTGRLLYIAGEVSSEGRWGEPHSVFDVTLDRDLPPDTPDLTLPEDLQGPEDSIRVQAAPSYSDSRTSLEVIIAPPAWSGRWGLGRALDVQERFQAVGYINGSDDGLFRPVAFWYGEDQVPVNQVLGQTLPVRAPLSSTSAASATAAPAPPTALDPLEVPAPSTERDGAPATSQDGSGSLGVWAVLGISIVAAVIGSWLYLRRRPRQG